MSQEQPKKYNDKEIEEMRKRVEKLDESDNPYKYNIYDLAKKEDEMRKEKEKNLKSLRWIFKNKKLNSKEKAVVNKEAESFSDETLGRMEAEKEKFIDDLTGLKNKNALLAEIPPILLLEKRKKEKCSFLMIDVDSFKKFNDTLGHLFADKALKTVADILKNACRESDLIYRFGGDEFSVLFPGASVDNVKEIVKRIMLYLNQANNEKILNTNIKLALSFGISIADYNEGQEYKNMDSLVREADSALYQSKKTGKNRVSVFGESDELESNK